MRNWLIKLLGGVTQQDYDKLYDMFMHQRAEWQATVDQHNMHGAWEQIKQKRKQGSMH